MTSLTDRFTEYLDHRRRFGADPASLELALKPFVTYADAGKPNGLSPNCSCNGKRHSARQA